MRVRSVIGGWLIACALCAPARTQPAPPGLWFNEIEIGEVSRAGGPDLKDPLAAFAYVFGRLPERVNVLPTENYYFRFAAGDAIYGGNIRLAAADRDSGKVHFAYHDVPSELRPDPEVRYVALDSLHGVTVEKLGALSYRVAHAGKSVVFALNDLSQVKPPAGLLHADEQYLGPIFDESAIRFSWCSIRG